jgi:hypothetical protein
MLCDVDSRMIMIENELESSGWGLLKGAAPAFAWKNAKNRDVQWKFNTTFDKFSVVKFCIGGNVTWRSLEYAHGSVHVKTGVPT